MLAHLDLGFNKSLHTVPILPEMKGGSVLLYSSFLMLIMRQVGASWGNMLLK